ncbi:hypothetical protein VTP01DRAFT_2847 [Rhizomucor pusillus]|uniref:uncharacterized protein n=1 Tax=Rhizomucor pusillus TaxID=4840 RepID=UPI003744ADE1
MNTCLSSGWSAFAVALDSGQWKLKPYFRRILENSPPAQYLPSYEDETEEVDVAPTDVVSVISATSTSNIDLSVCLWCLVRRTPRSSIPVLPAKNTDTISFLHSQQI